MKILKPYFHSADTKKAKIAMLSLIKKYKKYKLKDSNIIVVLGGDGTILSMINNEKF